VVVSLRLFSAATRSRFARDNESPSELAALRESFTSTPMRRTEARSVNETNGEVVAGIATKSGNYPPFWRPRARTNRSSSTRGPKAFKRDIPNAVVRFFDTGHFALETHAAEICRGHPGPSSPLISRKHACTTRDEDFLANLVAQGYYRKAFPRRTAPASRAERSSDRMTPA